MYEVTQSDFTALKHAFKMWMFIPPKIKEVSLEIECSCHSHL